MSASSAPCACERCLKRSWLLDRLAGNLDVQRHRLKEALTLTDRELILAVAGSQQERVLDEYDHLDCSALLLRAQSAGLEPICACDDAYPARLRELESAPAALYVAGGLQRFLALMSSDPVAIVGTRRASEYGLQSARSLARGVARAGLTVVSGMASGIDSAVHFGALEAGAATVAVLPGGADRPYPAAKRSLYRRVARTGAVISELAPGAAVRRWTFPARNRIIAALSAATVVVEGAGRSGALVTASWTLDLGRPLGAVPGRITSPLAHGPNDLITGGARLVRGAHDVLELVLGEALAGSVPDDRQSLTPELQWLLGALGEGCNTIEALSLAGLAPDEALASLCALELMGYVRRAVGGRYEVVP